MRENDFRHTSQRNGFMGSTTAAPSVRVLFIVTIVAMVGVVNVVVVVVNVVEAIVKSPCDSLSV